VGRSIDGGETLTTLNPDLALLDPSDNGSLCVLKNGDVICSHNHDADLRRNTLMKRSIDGGITWISGICIDANSSAYSTVCELSDGSIGVLYERNAYQEIVFSKFSLNELQPIDLVINNSNNNVDIEFTVVPRYIRPGRNQETEARLASAPTVHEVDMSGFNITERKEVGPTGGTTSGDPLYTADELEMILGPISAGLHVGDEVRFSVRITNNLENTLSNLRINDRNLENVFKKSTLALNSKECILDIRQGVTEADLAAGIARYEFELSGSICDAQGSEISEFKKIVNVEMPTK
jgi:sialidase-1